MGKQNTKQSFQAMFSCSGNLHQPSVQKEEEHQTVQRQKPGPCNFWQAAGRKKNTLS